MVWSNLLVYDKTRTEFLAWAADERDGQASSSPPSTVPSADSPRSAAIKVADLAKTLGTLDTLTQPYLDATREYYDTASAVHVANVQNGAMTGSNYVAWALDSCAAESARASAVISLDVADSVVQIVRHEAGELKGGDVVPKGEQLTLGRLLTASTR